MKKWKLFVLIFISFFILCVLTLGALARSPRFNPAYFTPAYLDKFSSPETVFDSMWDANNAGEKNLYAAVLGRDLAGIELTMKASIMNEIPKIDKVVRRKNSAYILAGRWGGSFEKIGGRWVFQNREFGFYARQFFRVFGIELARFQ